MTATQQQTRTTAKVTIGSHAAEYATHEEAYAAVQRAHDLDLVRGDGSVVLYFRSLESGRVGQWLPVRSY